MRREDIARMVTVGAFAGAAGGLAEVGWISLYAATTGFDAATVARGVTDTLRLATQAPVAAGITIHMGIAATLGIAVALALKPLRARISHAGFCAAVTVLLAAVWAVNFLLVLPVVNPSFVAIVPFAVSFVSKLMFGVAAAACLTIADDFGRVMPAEARVRSGRRQRR